MSIAAFRSGAVRRGLRPEAAMTLSLLVLAFFGSKPESSTTSRSWVPCWIRVPVSPSNGPAEIRTGWPTARPLSATPRARKPSGRACSRRLRAAPTNSSGTRWSPTARVALPTLAASAGSKASASMRRRPGSTISNSSSRASTTWPATTWADAITPDTGATSASRVASPPPTAAMRSARLAASLSAASMSLRGTVSANSFSRATRLSASDLAARSSASCAD